ncbi:MAG: hypothetical protein Q7T16_03340 [Candidatus Burarchaeum sp.]|nr:hypothetical protein [Candidatus Burarchaeum sp.]MDO8339666.1 hypothetical protein [Candidatus Burarchaeum sp.]
MKKFGCKAKKAQAAMEFLSTYGWAVLIIALVLVAIAWLGIFNVTGQVPDRCAFPVGTLTCSDAKVISGPGAMPQTVSNKLETITVTNNFGKAVKICGIACSAQSAVPETGLPDGATALTEANCYIDLGTGAVQVVSLYPDEKKTLNLVLGTLCKDAAGRADTYAVGSRYVGTLYVQYIFMGDTGKARIVNGDIIATVQQA